MRITTPPVSNQDAFNRAWDRLVVRATQGCCAVNDNCVYKAGDNNCVVGDMLPDEINVQLPINGAGSIEFVRSRYPNVKEHFKAVDTQLLTRLQWIHDNNYAYAETELTDLASNYNLTIPTV